MDWAHKMLLSVTDDFVDQFRSIGIVEALASIFKVCMCLIFSIFKYSPHVMDIPFPSDLKFLYFIFLLIGVLFTHMILFCGCQQGMDVSICFHNYISLIWFDVFLLVPLLADW